MSDHKEAVQHVLDLADWYGQPESRKQLTYVADMADWALELERTARNVLHLRGWKLVYEKVAIKKLEAVLAKRPGQETK